MTVEPEPVDRHKDVVVIEREGFEERDEVVVDDVARRHALLVRASQLIWLGIGVLEALFAVRVFLRLVAANPGALFAQFVYRFTALFLFPFHNLIGVLSAGETVLEVDTLMGMLVYAFTAWVVVKAIWLLFYRTYASSRTTQRRMGQPRPQTKEK